MKKRILAMSLVALSLSFMLTHLLPAIAKEGGSNSHGGDLVFYATTEALLSVGEIYLSRPHCQTSDLSSVFSSPAAFETKSEGATDFAIFQGERIERKNAAHSPLTAAISVMCARAGKSSIRDTAIIELAACLTQ